MAVFEIINPSDKVLIQSESFEAACLVTLIAGDGKYALQEVGGEGRGMPMFLFGGSDKWYAEKFGTTAAQGVDAIDKEVLAACFDSARIGDISASKEQTDKDRSSLNNIAGYCWKYAEAIRDQISKGVYDAR